MQTFLNPRYGPEMIHRAGRAAKRLMEELQSSTTQVGECITKKKSAGENTF